MSEAVEIPAYFLCPISLQIMKEPVTTITGITYERESIEKWLASSTSPILCPVTKQPLARGSDLTPNHILRRLIQAWCVASPNSGIEWMLTPKSPIRRSHVLKLIRDLNNNNNASTTKSESSTALSSLEKMHELANENESNRKCMSEFGVPKAMIHYIILRSKAAEREDQKTLIAGLGLALRVLHLTWTQTPENKEIVRDNLDLIQSITWILRNPRLDHSTKTDALTVLEHVMELASPNLMQKLSTNNSSSNSFFRVMTGFLLKNAARASPRATRAVLKTLIQTSPYGQNRSKIVEAGAVYELIQIELNGPEDKKTTELVFGLLASLCLTADGREQLLKHSGGLALVAKRILRVSNVTDDRAVCVLESIARFSGSREVVSEMLTMSAVTKLCMVLQADCAAHLKKKARAILRLHSSVWDGSPCIQVYLLTRYGR